ncbi:MAG: benzoyl-CoA reductase subunit C [Acidobacteriia bacterium]|nr:benzoyl-CoA reductase subunit C [Terriglobia bacterium]
MTRLRPTVAEIVEQTLALYEDLDFSYVRAWKSKSTSRRAVGFMPVYMPREIIHAAGMLPVGVMGGGDRLDIIKGDAYFQSYLCHIPRSTIELALSHRLDSLDGMVFPSICDVIRNLSGMWKLLFPEKMARYLDFPQNFDPALGGRFYRQELESLRSALSELNALPPQDSALTHSICLFNKNRRLVKALYDLRASKPWLVPTYEAYLLLRAGNILDVEEHTQLLEDYLVRVESEPRKPMDNIRVIVVGSFCEQPPLGLILTLERAGCYIVDDDFVLASRWITADISKTGDPLEALVEAYLKNSTFHSSKFEGSTPKWRHLIEQVKARQADGVVFAAPSFCDPALLDQPQYEKGLEEAGIAHTTFKYAENTGQFQNIREQIGTFSDSLKLWSEAP